MNTTAHLPWQQDAIQRHSQRLLSSFQHWTGHSLLPLEGTPETIAQALFEAPFVVLSHGSQADPVLNYGNQAALELWELDWEQFTQTPSRLTAEPIARTEREQLLQQAREKGFIRGYEAIRISRSGRRFRIQNVTLWDVLGEDGIRCGQAATFDRWELL